MERNLKLSLVVIKLQSIAVQNVNINLYMEKLAVSFVDDDGSTGSTFPSYVLLSVRSWTQRSD